MALKYDFNITQGNNIYIDSLVYVNDNINGLLVYTMVLMIFFVVFWVYNRYTDDTSLSFVYSMYVGVIFGILFYYLGLYLNVSLFSGNILMGMILIVVALSSLLWYSRNKLGGD